VGFSPVRRSQREVVVVKGGYVLTKDQRDRVGQELGPSEIQVTDDLFIGPTTPDEREGAMMHIPIGTVRSRLSRGRETLRRLMDVREKARERPNSRRANPGSTFYRVA
jgi:hypothetical protein